MSDDIEWIEGDLERAVERADAEGSLAFVEFRKPG